jgi:WD40 repeat protein
VLRDVASGRETLLGDAATTVSAVAFSPDGKTLAVGDAAHRVVLWDVVAHPHTITDWTIPGPVEQVAFSADGSRVAASDVTRQVSSNEDGAAPTHLSTEIQVFDAFAFLASPAQLTAQLCHELLGDDPNPAAWRATVPYVPYSQVCP